MIGIKTMLAATLMASIAIPAAQAQQPFDAKNIPPVESKVLRARDGLGNVLAKLKAGGEVKVAYFGGSITAGAGASNSEKTSYRALTTQWLKDTYPQTKITEINAAIGGTGSDLGAFRMGQDVLRYNPDLIFVEFAVNDAGASNENTLRGMEGIVRQAWRANPNTDICFIYTYTDSQQAEMDKGTFHRVGSAQDTLAQYYGIPAISVALPVYQLIHEGKMLPKPPVDAEGKPLPVPEGMMIFANEGVHPRDPAYAIYAKTIEDSLKEIETVSKPSPHTLKAPLMPDNWENAKQVPLDPSMLSGSWKKLDPNEGIAHQFAGRMPEMWEARTPGDKLTFKFKGTSAKLYDILGPDGGQVWVTVDGVKRDKPVARFDSYCSYWRLATLYIADGLPDAVHTVEVELDANQPDRTSVTSKEKDKPGFDPKKYDGTVLRVGSIMLIGDIVK